MDLSFMQVLGAIAMVAVTVTLFFAYRHYLALNSQRRMFSMIDSIGLDPAIVLSSDLETIMNDVRRRCESCTSEDVCERWLTCNEERNNDFCPNSRVFEVLKKHS